MIENLETQSKGPEKRYNLDRFKAFAAGDAESLRQILVSFIASCKRNAKHFRKSIDEKNISELSELSHKMLTLFRQLEAQDVVELLVQLEDVEELLFDDQQYFLLSRLALEKIESLLQSIQENENIT
ncbi:MAG: hypothetical protein K0M40_12440 [Prolixibacteraceae bacterium]|nr:hypothetical protein [Prolixibacteraceae bacterium]